MTLSGVDPSDPTPSDRREIILGVGDSGAPASSRPVLLWGNKLAPGTEPTNVVNTLSPITGEADAAARCGKRSELYWEYREYMHNDPGATIFIMAVPECGGNAAFCDFLIAGGVSASASTTLIFTILGVDYSVPVTIGDPVATVVANAVAKLNIFEDSKLPLVATDTSPNIRVTSSTKGPRHGSFLGGAGYGMRARFADPCTLTVTKSAVTAGTTEDDGTTAFANFAGAEFYYNVCPWITAAPSAVDNQIGELLDTIRLQDQPLGGKDQIIVGASVATNALTITMCSTLNSWLCHVVWQENSDWMPGMLAAAYAAVKRREEIRHPGANFSGWTLTDTKPWRVPPPALAADIPTQVEIKAALNNGFIPLTVLPNGQTMITRDVTTKNMVAGGTDKDYRARCGHVRSVHAFVWGKDKSRWLAQKQEFNDADPPAGVMPTANTNTPSMIKGIAAKVIEDCVASKPFDTYNGPILQQTKRQWMIDRVVPGYRAGTLTVSQQLIAVQHQYKSEWTLLGVDESY